jgi:hypothetical protein
MNKLDRPRLDVLADEIRTEVASAETAFQSALQHAITAGEKLIEAKGLVEHGQWLPWLEANFPGTDRTASTYMRLARNSETVSDLPTVRDAIQFLATPRLSPPSDPDRQLTPEQLEGGLRLARQDAQNQLALGALAVQLGDGEPALIELRGFLLEDDRKKGGDGSTVPSLDELREYREAARETESENDPEAAIARVEADIERELGPPPNEADFAKDENDHLGKFAFFSETIEYQRERKLRLYQLCIAEAKAALAETEDPDVVLLISAMITKATTGIRYEEADRACSFAGEGEYDAKAEQLMDAWEAHEAAKEAYDAIKQ